MSEDGKQKELQFVDDVISKLRLLVCFVAPVGNDALQKVFAVVHNRRKYLEERQKADNNANYCEQISNEVDVGKQSCQVVQSSSTSPSRNPSTLINLLDDPDLTDELKSVVLRKCTILDLYGISGVSSHLRAAVLARMSEMSLDIRIARNINPTVCENVVSIADLSDPNSTERFIFNINYVNHDKDVVQTFLIKKLINFCCNAQVRNISFDKISPDVPQGLKSRIRHCFHSIRESLQSEELLVENITGSLTDCYAILDFVSPRSLHIVFDSPVQSHDHMNAIANSRAARRVETIVFEYICDKSSVFYTLDHLMKFSAKSITILNSCATVFGYAIEWMMTFINFWLTKDTVLEHLHYQLGAEGCLSHQRFAEEIQKCVRNDAVHVGEVPEMYFCETAFGADVLKAMESLGLTHTIVRKRTVTFGKYVFLIKPARSDLVILRADGQRLAIVMRNTAAPPVDHEKQRIEFLAKLGLTGEHLARVPPNFPLIFHPTLTGPVLIDMFLLKPEELS